MAVVTRAYYFGEGVGFFQGLRDFLYRQGLRETTATRDYREIAEALRQGVWPIIIVDGSGEGGQDSPAIFETLHGRYGFELFPYVLVESEENLRISRHAASLGAKGSIRKPIHPIETSSLIRALVDQGKEPAVRTAIETAKLMIFERRFDAARASLQTLSSCPGFERSSEVALLRVETMLGHYSRAEERLRRLLTRYPGELRFLCEAADYMRNTSQLYTAIRFLKAIDGQNALRHRTWELGCLGLEVNDLEMASSVFEGLSKTPGYRDLSILGVVRVMMCLGLSEYVPQIVRAAPAVAKEYSNFVLKTRKVAV